MRIYKVSLGYYIPYNLRTVEAHNCFYGINNKDFVQFFIALCNITFCLSTAELYYISIQELLIPGIFSKSK